MNIDLSALAAILDEEIAVGEELNRNLAAQRQTLAAWDIVGLLRQIEAREPWLRTLSRLEEKRAALLKQSEPAAAHVTLRKVIAQLPPDGEERNRLRELRARAHALFTRLHTGERSLHGLMESLLSQIREALNPLMQPAVSLYGETGAAVPQRAESGLMRGKV